MAHYAFLDENNIVVEVIVGVDENITQIEADGTEVGGSSEAWENFYGNLRAKKCKRTSYNNRIRKQYAGLGYKYDADADVFISLQPYPSWTLDSNFDWQPPIPKPNEGYWYWDEENLMWQEYYN